MKQLRHLLAAALLLLSSTLTAQVDTVIVGERIDGTMILGLAYKFEQRIQEFSTDFEGRYICLQFRDTISSSKYLKRKGEIGFYDLQARQLLWKRPFDYYMEEACCMSEGVLITKGKNTCLLNKEDGSERWKRKFFPIYKVDSLNLLLGYKKAKGSELAAIDIKSGEELWNVELSRKYGWTEVQKLSNHELMIVADNLHRLNLKTGELLTYEGSTGVPDTRARLLQGLAMVAGGFATAAVAGVAVIPIHVAAEANTITSLSSNILFSDSLLYWADRKRISCTDSLLNVVWQTPLPDAKAGCSTLLMQDEKLYMVNYGYGVTDRKRKYGRPFIACFDPKDGRQLFFNQLSMKKDIVESSWHKDDKLCLLFDDGIAYQSFTDSVVNVKPWNAEKNGKLVNFLGNPVFLANEEHTAFEPIGCDNEHCFVYNESGEIFELTEELKVSRYISPESEIFFPKFLLKDYLGVRRNERLYFIHEIGMPVASMQCWYKQSALLDDLLILLTYNNQLVFTYIGEVIE